ncbi:hexokinase type 2-like [Littorina saxatilis]|uniref:hexokinase type 2-like n=1 Tax=Littorina saxatilis TaxID=31220 RepID=UPI0038B49E19
MNTLEREIKQGLDNITRSEEDNTTPSGGDDITQQDAALQMHRLHCPLLDQADNADLLVVDLGCTMLKMSYVKLREHAVFTTSKSYMMTTGTGNQMFAFIAESIKNFVCDNRLTEKKTLHAAIIFPFPCHQTSLKKARLAKCTRELSCEDIVNKDIQELLQSALQTIQTTCKVKIVAIVNDAVSTLVSVAHKTPECKIALTVGSGFNACFVEQWRRMGTNGTEEPQPEGVRLDLLRDRQDQINWLLCQL